MKARIASTALAAITLLGACAEEEILLARLPPAKHAGAPVEAKRCVDEVECPGNTYCERSDCRDLAGTCATRDIVCEEDPSPVCGCDGVTYWNDCLRRASGVTSMRPGHCEGPDAQPCGLEPGPGPGPGPVPPGSRGGGCGAGFSCARLLPPSPNQCPLELSGTCWALPAVCPPPTSEPDRWTPCGMPATACTTTCDAIRSGAPHQRATTCE
jgi:hypothetical protein